MQIFSLSALSAVVAVAGLVQAAPSAHAGADAMQHGSLRHRAIARDSRAARAATAVVPPTLKKKGVKRASNSTSTTTKCRVRSDRHGHNSATPTAASSTDNSAPTGSPTNGSGNSSTPWNLVRSHQGSNFFDAWTFWNQADPTHGAVNFLDSNTAWSSGLVSINGQGQAVMAVDTTPTTGGNRNSIRIADDQFTFNINTLILMDSTHMPTGCGSWPAFWSNGNNWPYQGEIDIVEGVNTNTENQSTLHTSSGCSATSDSAHPSTGDLLGSNCDVTNGSNNGCGFLDSSSSNNYGQGFNDINGGVYAMQWVDTGISVWFFPRTAIPSDITSNAPMPWTWPSPFAHWSASGCNPSQFFQDNFAIFDTTLCGDWAGSVWSSGGCAESTGYSTCEDFVANQGGQFSEAYWAVNYVKYFQQN